MEKRNIGKSGLSAPFLGMGTWAIGGGSWWGDNDDALSVKAILTAVEQGITWVDTAPIYGLYHSEEVVGEALKHLDRDKIILSTKCGLEWRHESPVLHKVVDGVQVYRDLSEKSILEDVEESLKRLGTDHIDVLYTHWQSPDFSIFPLEETVEAMMKEGEYEKTLAFIQKWKKSEGTKNKIIYSQNRIVDAVIDGVLGAELERNEITLNYSGKIPQQIGIDDLDLCLLISNLLENAKEAVQKLDTGERQIGLKIGRKESLICINIRNPYTQGGECVKEEGWHGYGLKNVKEIVEKYDGEIQVQDINNIFTVSIILESTQNE